MNDLEEVKKTLYHIIDAINYAERITQLPCCNDCGRKNCSYAPNVGEYTRINCFYWIPNGVG